MMSAKLLSKQEKLLTGGDAWQQYKNYVLF